MPSQLIAPDGYEFARLDTERHSRDEFSCGKPDLDTFLRTQAAQAQGKYMSATHVLLPARDMRTIVGYITLVSSEIPLAERPPNLKRVSDKPRLPALLLARMAVDSAHKGRRLGEFLLKYALSTALEMNEASGCLLVVVDAMDEDSKNFYVHFGFTSFPDNNLRLFMPVSTIQQGLAIMK